VQLRGRGRIRGRGCGLIEATFEPSSNRCGNVTLLDPAERPTGWDAMPFGEAGATAGGSRVLRHEGGMATHWCLLAVIRRRGRCEALGDEFLGVVENSGKATRLEKSPLLWTQTETSAEW
jgi:hypothetical protein